MESYEKIKKIGRGTYGDVILVKNKHNQALMALKKVVLENLQSSSSSGRNSKQDSIPTTSQDNNNSKQYQSDSAGQKIGILNGIDQSSIPDGKH